MEIATTHYKRCSLVKASGRVDSQTAPQLEQVFEEINQGGQFNIVFDMSSLSFVSSAGLRVMINTQKKAKRLSRGELVLASVPERIHEALDLAGFIPLFSIFGEVVEAVAGF